MAFDREIEATKSITTKRISTALKYDTMRSIVLHDRGDDWFENKFVVIWEEKNKQMERKEKDHRLTIVSDAFTKWNIDWIVSTSFSTDLIHTS